MLWFAGDDFLCYWTNGIIDVEWAPPPTGWRFGGINPGACPFCWPPNVSVPTCWTPLVNVPFTGGTLSLTPM